jgi:two-component system, cell cycle sensor histidine kinase and response regulator CckA
MGKSVANPQTVSEQSQHIIELQALIETLKQEVLDGARTLDECRILQKRLSESNDALKAGNAARAAAEAEFGRMFDTSPDMMAVSGLDGFFKRVNPALLQTMGYSQQELLRKPLRELIHPADLETVTGQIARLAKGEEVHYLHYRVRHNKGHYLHTEWAGLPPLEVGVFFTIGRDITARIEMEESLRDALASMRNAERIGKVGSWEVDAATGASVWSDETFRICGFTPGQVTPHRDLFDSLVHPDDAERVRAELEHSTGDNAPHRLEYRFLLTDGSVHDIVANFENVNGPEGQVARVRGTVQDVTDAMQSVRAHAKLEEQLRAGQKMEAIGSLAGGIAHDFNNLLSVIMTYVGFVMDALPAGDTRRDDLQEVQKAAERAAVLTRQLLAFGRKQVLNPVSLNLNEVATGLEKMLRRILHEDITLVLHLAPHLGCAMADPGQIEQVIMNLVVNARDAMPGGGRLTIATANVELDDDQVSGLNPGRYVMLSVSDTGTGMDAATKARMFEPFFTTKEVGKGTGLELPTVYGILKQSGGHITVYSEPGVGSTFRAYLPRGASSAAQVHTPELLHPIDVRGTETILVVEDEDAVRKSAARILSSCGYTVLTAEHGLDALQVLELHAGKVSLVLTDVIMPKMNGELLAREIGRLWPQTHVLFMSGYSGDAILGGGALNSDTHFIGKPFNASDLTRKVRQLLDAGTNLHGAAGPPVVESRA